MHLSYNLIKLTNHGNLTFILYLPQYAFTSVFSCRSNVTITGAFTVKISNTDKGMRNGEDTPHYISLTYQYYSVLQLLLVFVLGVRE